MEKDLDTMRMEQNFKHGVQCKKVPRLRNGEKQEEMGVGVLGGK